ncbi:MAG: hypothetical protein AB7L65_10815 [Hyphomonadaceae bacterium]
MLDKALNTLIGATLVCAATALTVFALGFALFALTAPALGPAGAAAGVAGAAAGVVAIAALVHMMRQRDRETRRALEAAQAHEALTGAIPEPLRALMQRHPIAAIAASLAGGLLAARNPRIIREVIAALRMPRP